MKKAFTLAEGATHVAKPPVIHRRPWIDIISARFCSIEPRPAEGSKVGFTLAEVLITLGIIGVVAAMTIPVLLANTTSQKYRSKFKKTISTLSQAARMSDAQYGFDYSGINVRCSKNGGTEHPENIMSVCSIINGTIKSATYFLKASDIKLNKAGKTENYSITSNFTKNQVTSLSNLSNVHAYVLNDGTIIAFSPYMGTFGCTLKSGEVLKDGYSGTNMASCAGFIDVNGVDLPNKEVSCSSGSNSLSKNNCIVKNNAKDLTDIYPIRFHDGVVEPATAAARYVLRITK